MLGFALCSKCQSEQNRTSMAELHAAEWEAMDAWLNERREIPFEDEQQGLPPEGEEVWA